MSKERENLARTLAWMISIATNKTRIDEEDADAVALRIIDRLDDYLASKRTHTGPFQGPYR